MSEGENSVKLEINDEEAYLEMSREFIEQNLQKLEAMLRDILFNQKIKEVKITIRSDAINQGLRVKKCFDPKDICWLKNYGTKLEKEGYWHVSRTLKEEIT